MTRAQQTLVIVAALFMSVGALAYFFAPKEPETAHRPDASVVVKPSDAAATDMIASSDSAAGSKPRISAETERSMPSLGKPFSERFDELGITLKFVPTAEHRRLIEYATPAIPTEEDGTCTQPYAAREEVIEIRFAWGFVIDRFWTWNDQEGQQEYIVDETELPRAWQGSLYDFIRKGKTVTVTKQRCGMGQVAALVTVRP